MKMRACEFSGLTHMNEQIKKDEASADEGALVNQRREEKKGESFITFFLFVYRIDNDEISN